MHFSFCFSFRKFPLLLLLIQNADLHKGHHKSKAPNEIKTAPYVYKNKPYTHFVEKIFPNKENNVKDSLTNILGKYSTDEIQFPSVSAKQSKSNGRGMPKHGKDRHPRKEEDVLKISQLLEKASKQKTNYLSTTYKDEEHISPKSKGKTLDKSISSVIDKQVKKGKGIGPVPVVVPIVSPPQNKKIGKGRGLSNKTKPVSDDFSKMIEQAIKEKAKFIANNFKEIKDKLKEKFKEPKQKQKGRGMEKKKKQEEIDGGGRGMSDKAKPVNDDFSKMIDQTIKAKAEFIANNFKEIKGNGGVEGKGSDKPSWFFRDPHNLIGKKVSNYEPTDPNEPRPSERIDKGDGDENGKDNNEGDGGQDNGETEEGDKAEGAGDDEGMQEMDLKEDDESLKTTSKDEKATPKQEEPENDEPAPPPSDGSRKLPVVIDFGDDSLVDPSSPGWFALKDTSEYGKQLKLGTLLRKPGDGSEHEYDNDDYSDKELDNVDDALDGLNDDGSEKMSSLLHKYDKACLWQEYQEAKANSTDKEDDYDEPSLISETIRQKVNWQNEQLSYFLLNLALTNSIKDFKASPLLTQVPTGAFELLHLTTDIFINNICKDMEYKESEDGEHYDPNTDKILPKPFIETTSAMFLKLYELTKNKQSVDYLSEKETAWIKANLEQCNQTNGMPKKIQWFVDECKETVVAFDQMNNYACTPYLDYDFNVKKYDPLLDFIWHMIASVHSHCFESFQTNIRMWHRYALAMADLFTVEMRMRWTASTEDNKKLYTRLFGPHYEIYFDNMNRCMYAATLRSNVPYLLPRFVGNRGTRFAPFTAQDMTTNELGAPPPA